jgi:hypothetical protein
MHYTVRINDPRLIPSKGKWRITRAEVTFCPRTRNILGVTVAPDAPKEDNKLLCLARGIIERRNAARHPKETFAWVIFDDRGVLLWEWSYEQRSKELE